MQLPWLPLLLCLHRQLLLGHRLRPRPLLVHPRYDRSRSKREAELWPLSPASCASTHFPSRSLFFETLGWLSHTSIPPRRPRQSGHLHFWPPHLIYRPAEELSKRGQRCPGKHQFDRWTWPPSPPHSWRCLPPSADAKRICPESSGDFHPVGKENHVISQADMDQHTNCFNFAYFPRHSSTTL